MLFWGITIQFCGTSPSSYILFYVLTVLFVLFTMHYQSEIYWVFIIQFFRTSPGESPFLTFYFKYVPSSANTKIYFVFKLLSQSLPKIGRKICFPKLQLYVFLMNLLQVRNLSWVIIFTFWWVQLNWKILLGQLLLS
jgi:hypothetical protein